MRFSNYNICVGWLDKGHSWGRVHVPICLSRGLDAAILTLRVFSLAHFGQREGHSLTIAKRRDKEKQKKAEKRDQRQERRSLEREEDRRGASVPAE